ncbi:MAG: hypothetical protein LBF84_03375 [Holosporales bacterium]|nr:hypothetical protein [Holosporales bacterium]
MRITQTLRRKGITIFGGITVLQYTVAKVSNFEEFLGAYEAEPQRT